MRTIKEYLGSPIPLAFGAIIFLSMAHHLLNFWERSALIMAGMFIIGVSAFGYVTAAVWKRTAQYLVSIGRKRLFQLSIPAALVGIFITVLIRTTPESYHSLTITPLISGDEAILLLEVKADSVVVDVSKTAFESNWYEDDHGLYATKNSGSFTVSFRSKVDQPVTVLFEASPRSGGALISLDHQTTLADLHSSTKGEDLFKLQPRYRGIPNWLFSPALFIIDVVSIGLAILFLLLMQELGQREAGPLSQTQEIHTHRKNVLTLLVLGVIFHTLNALAVPLFLGPDSPSFLEGSTHLLKFGNMDGVSMIRGPGTTLLFTPIMFIFGRNAWGIKIMLHLIALACIPVSYRIGWQLSNRSAAAFISGLLAVLSPDLLFYSNYIMSDVPNIFFVLTFITLLLSAMSRPGKRWIVSTVLLGSFAVLWRSENIVMLILGLMVLSGSAFWKRRKTKDTRMNRLLHIGLAFGIALLPILWWSGHNARVHGFFGMSNYSGEVFYDGWVYFGDASRLSFSDPDSRSVQTINKVLDDFPPVITDRSGVPTGWEIYPSLLEAGFNTDQAFELMASAAWDSILLNKETAVQLLFMKYQDGLTPEITHDITYPLPGEAPKQDSYKAEYFDHETLSIPPLIRLQRQVNEWTRHLYPRLYPAWVLFCILTVFLSLFRSPWDRWLALTSITASRIFIPLTIGVAFWRYTLAGWIPAQIIAVVWLWVFFSGINVLFGEKASRTAGA